MSKVIFSGTEDFRILAAADLSKAGVEGFKKTTFSKGEETEVDENVAQALLSDPDLFGKFTLAEPAESAVALISTEEVNAEAPAKKSARTN